MSERKKKQERFSKRLKRDSKRALEWLRTLSARIENECENNERRSAAMLRRLINFEDDTKASLAQAHNEIANMRGWVETFQKQSVELHKNLMLLKSKVADNLLNEEDRASTLGSVMDETDILAHGVRALCEALEQAYPNAATAGVPEALQRAREAANAILDPKLKPFLKFPNPTGLLNTEQPQTIVLDQEKKGKTVPLKELVDEIRKRAAVVPDKIEMRTGHLITTWPYCEAHEGPHNQRPDCVNAYLRSEMGRCDLARLAGHGRHAAAHTEDEHCVQWRPEVRIALNGMTPEEWAKVRRYDTVTMRFDDIPTTTIDRIEVGDTVVYPDDRETKENEQ